MRTVYIAHATSDERKKLTGGQPGDQTGSEVKIQEWYSRPWTVVLRSRSPYKRALIAKAMCEAARNDNIGYCQGHRRTLHDIAKNYNYQLSKVRESCECDCSSLVAVALIAAGYNISPDAYTGNLEAAILATQDFEVYKDQLHVSLCSALIPGDILLYPGHHVAVAVSTANESLLGSGWWYDIDGWHYRDGNINILYGFKDINHHRYFFSEGVMQTGLIMDHDKWYLFEADEAHPYQGGLYITDSQGVLSLMEV